jgi:serine/threonine protein kinase
LTFTGPHSITSENKSVQFVLLIQSCIYTNVDFVMFQLCTGGSVTDLVQGLKHRNERLTEDQIAYIIRETVEVLYIPAALIN